MSISLIRRISDAIADLTDVAKRRKLVYKARFKSECFGWRLASKYRPGCRMNHVMVRLAIVAKRKKLPDKTRFHQFNISPLGLGQFPFALVPVFLFYKEQPVLHSIINLGALFMAFIKRLLFKYRDLLTYTFFGFLASLVNIFTYWIFRHTIIWPYLLANTIAWLLANLFGFFTNKSLVFQSKYTTFKALFGEVLSFFFFRGVSFFLDNGLMIVAISFLGWQSMTAKIIDQLIVGIVNYITTSYTFKKSERQMALRGRILRHYHTILKRGDHH